jgi:hypothetical protein
VSGPPGRLDDVDVVALGIALLIFALLAALIAGLDRI